MLANCKQQIKDYSIGITNDYLIANSVIPSGRKALLLVQSLPSASLYFLLAMLLAIPLLAGINKKLVVKPDTPDGNFLDLIGLEIDFDKRVALIEQFTLMFPRSESIS